MDISSEKGTRHQRGNATAELPVVLFIVFMGLAFPLIDLVTAGIRYAVLVSATRMAAERAGRAHSFTEARSLVSDWVDRYQSSFSGIKIDTIGVQIVAISKENPKDVQIKPGPLQPAEDLEDNVYEIEVSIKGKIDPLMRIPMLHVAGLSDPLVITATSRNVVEDPNDLKI